jgi:hypothetical protein
MAFSGSFSSCAHPTVPRMHTSIKSANTKDTVLFIVFSPCFFEFLPRIKQKTPSFPSGNESATAKRAKGEKMQRAPTLWRRGGCTFLHPKMLSCLVLRWVFRLMGHPNYGNGGCDGFSPNFPLIRLRGTTAKVFCFVFDFTIISHPHAACQAPRRIFRRRAARARSL